jgi:hypothetical protein
MHCFSLDLVTFPHFLDPLLGQRELRDSLVRSCFPPPSPLTYELLGVYMKKIEYVLGAGWEQYAEGQKLVKEEAAFRRQLDTSALYNKWLGEESGRPPVGGPIFCMTKNRLKDVLELSINFDKKRYGVFYC